MPEKNLTVKEILEVTKGELICGAIEKEVVSYSNDTRTIEKGDLYLGIRGEKFNGSNFYKEAIKKGAIGAIIQDIQITNKDREELKDKIIIKVNNVVEAIQEMAKAKRNKYDIPIVAITGSVGKTSTKDMVASIIEQKYNVLKTQGNLNNHIGLPLTILKLREHNFLVVEMGMNNLGEIRVLSNIAKPTACAITNVGTSHIGNLGSRENILKAKLEILEGMQNHGAVILNNDNDLLHNWIEQNRGKYHIVTYGIENASQYIAYDIQENQTTSDFKVRVNEKEYEVTVPIPGRHFILNALCAMSVGLEYGIEMEKIKEGIAKFELTKKRMEIVNLPSDVTVINDCYNANYDSMKAALEYLGKIQGKRRVAVLGDMLELGDYAKQLHEKIGEEVVKNKIDLLLTAGQLAKDIAGRADYVGLSKEKIHAFDNTKLLIDAIKNYIKPGDTILIKASNAMGFDKIIEAIK